MPYDELRGNLQADPTAVTVAAFPDGSVDTYYRVLNGDEYVTDREAFCEVVAAGRGSMRLERRRRLPGGQTVNMSEQAAALGDEVTLAGHLDDHVFADLDVETVSLGEPAAVRVLLFGDADLLLAEPSADVATWDGDDLRDAVGDLAAFLEADLICSGNWGVYPDDESVFEAVEATGSGGTFVFDPGSIGGLSDRRRRTLLAGLGRLEPTYRTVLAGNRTEIESLAAAVDADGDLIDQAEQVRAEAGLSGVVAHLERKAAAATPDGAVVVPNLDTTRVTTVTGAGDRFTAGLGHGLAAGWEWEPALALGNVCASYHVVHAATIERDGVVEYARRHDTTF